MRVLENFRNLLVSLVFSAQVGFAGDAALVIGDQGQIEYQQSEDGIRTRDFTGPLRRTGFEVFQPKNRSSGHMRLIAQRLETALEHGTIERLVIVVMGPIASTARESWALSNGSTAPTSLNIGVTALPIGALSDMASRAKGRAVILIAPGKLRRDLGAGLKPGLLRLSPADGVTYAVGPAPDLLTVLTDNLLKSNQSFADVVKNAPRSISFSGFLSDQVGLLGPVP